MQALGWLLPSLWFHMSFAQLTQRALFRHPPSPLALTPSPPALLWCFLNSEERDLVATSLVTSHSGRNGPGLWIRLRIAYVNCEHSTPLPVACHLEHWIPEVASCPCKQLFTRSLLIHGELLVITCPLILIITSWYYNAFLLSQVLHVFFSLFTLSALFHICTCVHVWRHRSSSSTVLYLNFWYKFLHFRTSPTWLGRLGSKLQWCACLLPRIRGVHRHALVFMWVLGIQTQVSDLQKSTLPIESFPQSFLLIII